MIIYKLNANLDIFSSRGTKYHSISQIVKNSSPKRNNYLTVHNNLVVYCTALFARTSLYFSYLTIFPGIECLFLLFYVLPDDWIDCGLPGENRAPHALSWLSNFKLLLLRDTFFQPHPSHSSRSHFSQKICVSCTYTIT